MYRHYLTFRWEKRSSVADPTGRHGLVEISADSDGREMSNETFTQSVGIVRYDWAARLGCDPFDILCFLINHIRVTL